MATSVIATPSAIVPTLPEPPAISAALEPFPDLRNLPHSYIVHRATDDRNAPLIKNGEIVVVDLGSVYTTGGWLPREGGLFLIEYTSDPASYERYARRSRSIVQTFTDQRGRWCAGSTRRGIQGREFFVADGPYPDEQMLADKLIGKVVGIYAPQAGGLN